MSGIGHGGNSFGFCELVEIHLVLVGERVFFQVVIIVMTGHKRYEQDSQESENERLKEADEQFK